MIVETLFFETDFRVARVYLEKYNAWEIVHANFNLHKTSIDEKIESMKQIYKDEFDDLVLLVVKYNVPPDNPYYATVPDATWQAYLEEHGNVWGFKIINPKHLNV